MAPSSRHLERRDLESRHETQCLQHGLKTCSKKPPKTAPCAVEPRPSRPNPSTIPLDPTDTPKETGLSGAAQIDSAPPDSGKLWVAHQEGHLITGMRIECAALQRRNQSWYSIWANRDTAKRRRWLYDDTSTSRKGGGGCRRWCIHPLRRWVETSVYAGVSKQAPSELKQKAAERATLHLTPRLHTIWAQAPRRLEPCTSFRAPPHQARLQSLPAQLPVLRTRREMQSSQQTACHVRDALTPKSTVPSFTCRQATSARA